MRPDAEEHEDAMHATAEEPSMDETSMTEPQASGAPTEPVAATVENVPPPLTSLPAPKPTRGRRSQAALRARQLRVLALLCAGADDNDIAAGTACSTSIIRRWRRKDPWFAAELSRMLDDHRSRIEGMLASLVPAAKTVLTDAIGAVNDDGKAAHAIRLRAAERVLASYEQISRRAAEAPHAPVGPLIVLPAGTARIALLVETGGSAGPAAGTALGRFAAEPGPAAFIPATAVPVDDAAQPPLQPRASAPIALDVHGHELPASEPLRLAQPEAPGMPRWWSPLRFAQPGAAAQPGASE